MFFAPTKIFFGSGHAYAKEMAGRRVLLHHSGGSSERNGVMDSVRAALKAENIFFTELSGVVPNPRLSKVMEGIELCRSENLDFILAVGGGSVIDSAKAISLGVANPKTDIWQFFEKKAVAEKSLPVGAVLTIPAAGSEMSKSVVITRDDGVKRGYTSELNCPVFSVLDPALCKTLPKKQIACGIVDIMMHTLERFISSGGNYLTDKIAVSVLQTVLKFGKAVYDDAGNYEAMSELMWAGCLSHNDITGLGNDYDMPVHALGHEFSGVFDVAHGESLSAVWPSYARFCYAKNPRRFDLLFGELYGLSGAEGIEKLTEYFVLLSMPVTITKLCGGRMFSEGELEKFAFLATYSGGRELGKYFPLTLCDLTEILINAQEK